MDHGQFTSTVRPRLSALDQRRAGLWAAAICQQITDEFRRGSSAD
jgi:hypothetical protein